MGSTMKNKETIVSALNDTKEIIDKTRELIQVIQKSANSSSQSALLNPFIDRLKVESQKLILLSTLVESMLSVAELHELELFALREENKALIAALESNNIDIPVFNQIMASLKESIEISRKMKKDTE